MAAAVSDYVPAYPQAGKIKKVQIGENWKLELKQNIDLLSTLDRSGIKTVAFKAEMDADEAIRNASGLIDTKEVDAVCLNLLQGSESFGTVDNQIDFITAGGLVSIPKADKLSLSLSIVKKAAAL
jgi:phosphopantothenoylcysteine decarboxylase/phosphopantothenate--cysteine ligase